MSKITKIMYAKTLPYAVITIIIGNINVLIDGFITSKMIGTKELGVLGFAIPLLSIVALYSVVISGARVLCGNYIGMGDKKNANDIFMQSVKFTAVWSIFWMCIIFLFGKNLALLLCSNEKMSRLISLYLRGLGFGMVFTSVYNAFCNYLILKGKGLVLDISIGIMIVCNLSLDICFANLGMGMFGMGLASSISCIVAFLVTLPFFIAKNSNDDLICFVKTKLNIKKVMSMIHIGIGSLTFFIMGIISSYVINKIVFSLGGVAAMSAYTTRCNIKCMTDAISLGVGSATGVVTSILYGEGNRKILRDGVLIPQIIAVIMGIITMVPLCVFSLSMVELFVGNNFESVLIAQIFLIMLGLSLPFSGFYVFVNIYQSQKKVKMSVIAGILEPIMLVVFSLLLSPIFKTYAVAYATLLSIIASSIIVWLITCGINKKISFKIDNLFLFDSDYGMRKEDRFFATIENEEDVAKISKNIIAYFKGDGFNDLICYRIGLYTEKLCEKILENGIKKGRRGIIEITTCANNNKLNIILKDNFNTIDLKSYMEQFDDTLYQMEKKPGIEVASNLLDTIEHQKILGVNVTRLVFSKIL